jgi:GT2 family glycosyltransferase
MSGEGHTVEIVEATVVIPTRGRRAMARDAVYSLLAAPASPAEVLIVDQSDQPDDALDALEHVGRGTVRYIHTPEPGVSRARNIGLRAATHETVVLLDDDMLVEGRALAHLVEARGEEPHVIATGPVLAAEPEERGLAQAPASLHTDTQPARHRGRQHRLVIPGGNIAVSRSFALAAGGYDERLGPGTRFGAGEDHDLALRLLDAGAEVAFVPDAAVLHRAWRRRRELVRLRWAYGRGVGAFFAKHLLKRDRWALDALRLHLSARLSGIAHEVVRSPYATTAHVVSLMAVASGMAEWTVLRALERALGRRLKVTRTNTALTPHGIRMSRGPRSVGEDAGIYTLGRQAPPASPGVGYENAGADRLNERRNPGKRIHLYAQARPRSFRSKQP